MMVLLCWSRCLLLYISCDGVIMLVSMFVVVYFI